ncbi:MAG: hypothetical protein JEZ00_10255 [Anaerolineaceae bacterium]|nr:hypothetical protein [Anaerolineaceae bacterium]
MKKTIVFNVLLCLSLLLSSCNLPNAQTAQPEIPDSPEGVMTAVALTVQANEIATQLAGGGVVVTTEQSAEQPGVQATDPVVLESPTIQPTGTDAPTITPSYTSTSIPCDRASFVTDVTVPDGTVFKVNEDFTKTWRIKNNGSCTWNTSYDLIFDSGDAMNGPTAVDITSSVAPGQTIDISVNLKAPDTAGTYKGYWKIRNASGAVFGIGTAASNPFWVEIKAQYVLSIIPGILFLAPRYNMATAYCDADWVSGAGARPCPGSGSDAGGFVIRKDNPTLQDGTALNGIALETHPEWVNNGVITGRFPSFTIEDGDHFKAKIGCLQGGSGCNVEFQLNYKVGATLTNLAKWNMAYADAPKDVDVDLSSLDGQSIQLVLAVTAKGSSSQDWAIWYWPRVTK